MRTMCKSRWFVPAVAGVAYLGAIITLRVRS
jgi:hypothetical protein